MLLLSNLLADNEDGTLAPRQVEFARTIFAAGKDLLALINQVLDLAKVESGRQEIEIGPVPLAELAERARRVFTPLARDKGLSFTVTVGAGLPETIPTDRRRLEQIVTNLLGNAIKFTVKGEVALRIEGAASDARFRRSDLEPGDVVAFSVSDTGLGIAPEDHERVFAPFEQVDAAADRRYGGTASVSGSRASSRRCSGASCSCGARWASAAPSRAFYRGRGRRVDPGTRARRPGLLGEGARVRELAGAGARSGEPFLLLIEDDPVFAATFGEVIEGKASPTSWRRTAKRAARRARAAAGGHHPRRAAARHGRMARHGEVARRSDDGRDPRALHLGARRLRARARHGRRGLSHEAGHAP